MNAKEYRAKKVKEYDVETPSGVFKVRRPSLTELIRHGKIPTAMYKIAARISGLEGDAKLDESDPEQVKAMLNFMAVYVCAASVEPKVVMTKEKDDSPETLAVDDLDEQDLFTLFHATFNRREESGLASETFSEKSGSGSPGRSGTAV